MVRNTLFLRLSQFRGFWEAQHAWKRIGLFVFRRLLTLRGRGRQEIRRGRSLLHVIKLTAAGVLLAISSAAFLQYTNSYVAPILGELGLRINPDAESQYAALLTALTTAGGIFIGLYYAAISAIGAGIYARVPNDLRRLLAQERLGSAYMFFLASLTVLGLTFLGFHVAGFEPVALAVPLMVIFGGVAVIGFVRLGARAFFLSDPTSLSSGLLRELQSSYQQVQVGSLRWSDELFQNHAHSIAQAHAETLDTVAGLTAREPHLNGRPFFNLSKALLALLQEYERARPKIPTKSNWYGKRFVFEDWYRAGHSETRIAHETSTGLQPTPVSDPRWLEAKLLPIVYRCLTVNAKLKRYDIVVQIVECLRSYTWRLAQEHNLGYAFDVTEATFRNLSGLILGGEEGETEVHSLGRMAICERIAHLPLAALLGYIETRRNDGRDEILKRIQSVRWQSLESIYLAGFKEPALETLEWLRPRLEYEQKLEGRKVSPRWYLCELVARSEVKNLVLAMECLHDRARRLYNEWRKLANDANDVLMEATILAVESEYLSKLNHHASVLSELQKNLTSDKRIDGLSWPRMDASNFDKGRREHKVELLAAMSKQDMLVRLTPRKETFPDYAGQFLHTVGEAVLAAICSNDCKAVQDLFGRYFVGTIGQFSALMPEQGIESRSEAEGEARVAFAPLLDLMAISGYAYLFSDHYASPQLKQAIVRVWDSYLREEKAKQRLEFLAAAVAVSEERILEVPHRSHTRSQWKQTVSQQLSNIETKEKVLGSSIVSDTIVQHESPLVRMFASSWPYLSHDGIDIFISQYIRQRRDGKELDFGRRRGKEFDNSIAAEIARYEQAKLS